MPGKSRFTPTEDLLAKRIKQEYIKRGYDNETAKRIAYATVTKLNKSPNFRRKVTRIANKRFSY